jgi:hypothetical protein
MSTQRSRAYTLLKPVSAEYTRDVRPFPSGYARVSIIIQPRVDHSAAPLVIEIDPDWSWNILEVRDIKSQVHEIPLEIEEGLRGEAIEGIRVGAETALLGYFDASIHGVEVIVRGITFHPVYSTVTAFKLATQKAVENALEEAEIRGFVLRRSDWA